MSTLVTREENLGIGGVKYETHTASPTKQYTFVTSTKGIIPLIIRELLSARKAAKKEMEREDDAKRKALLNARQLALKVSANSVYGFMGAVKRGMFPCLAIADSVTCRGRLMIERTCELVKEFTPCDVIYGDTDSVMLQLKDKHLSIEETFSLGEKMASWVTDKFPKDVTLEMEKVYCPWLLLAKKRYAGLMYTPAKDGSIQLEKMDAKGLELVRRDNCKFAKQIYERILKALLYDGDVDQCKAVLGAELDRLANNEVRYEDYIISKQMKKKESYANEMQPHLIVADKMRARVPGSEPQHGDRVPYIIIEGPEEKISERAEDPVYARENALKVDRLYYLNNQIINSVTSLLTPVIDSVPDLFRKYVDALEMQRLNQQTLLERKQNSQIFTVTLGESGGGAPPARKGNKRKKEMDNRQQCIGDFLS
jgi:DNA polymerase delta subunit 1